VTTGFRAAVCQSPSFWWNQERFAMSLPLASGVSPAFWVSVGDLETDCGVSHSPTGLFQAASQRDVCERAAAALRAAGYKLSHPMFHGGHHPECWREDLAAALRWAAAV
jgi:predicted alpha/beta superfamily hydrolase